LIGARPSALDDAVVTEGTSPEPVAPGLPGVPAFVEVRHHSPSASTAPPALTLVVPAYNESDRLDAGSGRLWGAVEGGAIDLDRTEVLVVDDASHDDTAQRAGRLLAGVPRLRVVRLRRHAGKGACVRTGMALARGSRIAFTDADMAIEPRQLPALVGALDEGDLAIGARGLAGSSVDVTDAVRGAGAKAFSWFVNFVTNVHLEDTQCGFKAFRAPVGRLLFHWSVIDGFAFDVEVLSLARQLELTVREVPVHWLRVQGSSIRALRDPLAMVRDVAVSRLRRPRGTVAGLQLGPVTDGSPALAQLVGMLEPGVPILTWADGTVTALFPLCSDAVVRDVERRVRQAWPALPCRRTAFGFHELCALAPLPWWKPPATGPRINHAP
jgi:dolichyl-phosphate beta-glucosyltransferase